MPKPQPPVTQKRDSSASVADHRSGQYKDSNQTSPIGYRYTGHQFGPKPVDSKQAPPKVSHSTTE